MKYVIKAITTNNRDLKTAIYLLFDERAYLFNVPDGFQRMALNQKMKFGKVRYVFLSSLHPDYYGGFPGFYLSAREAQSADLSNMRISVFGPKLIRKLIQQGFSFYSNVSQMEIFDYGLMTGNTREYKSVDGASFRFEEVNKLLKSKQIKGIEEEIKMEDVVVQNVVDGEKIVVEEEEKKGGAEQSSKMQGLSPRSDRSSNFDSKSPSTCFNDGNLHVIPVQIVSSDQREYGCYSFICVPRQDRGKFLPKKALELGCNVKLNHFKLLCEGQAVTLDNGNIVHPFQVMEAPFPSQAMIFVFMPNEKYLENFLTEEKYKEFEAFADSNTDPQKMQMALIYHSVPLSVILNPKYRDFMYRFGSKTKHIIDCHEANEEVIARFKSQQLSQRHALVCPSLIPMSPVVLTNYQKDTAEQLATWIQDIQYINSRVGLSYNLYPPNDSCGLDNSQAIGRMDLMNETEAQIIEEMKKLINIMVNIKQTNEPGFNYGAIMNPQSLSEIDPTEPSVMFLGTVSMKPTQYRSASAVMVFIRGHGILMDCAEGSYGQLLDHFMSYEKVNEVIWKLRLVFITHIHGDHQLGIIKIMAERDKLVDEALKNGQTLSSLKNDKLYIVTPSIMREYLDTVRTNALKYPEMIVMVNSHELNPEKDLYYGYGEEGLIRSKPADPQACPAASTTPEKDNSPQQSFMDQKKPKKPCPIRNYEEVIQMIEEQQPTTSGALEMNQMLNHLMGVKKILAIEVDHCTDSYGCLIVSQKERGDGDGFGRIFYSGDTVPCQNVLNYCQNVSLLIHEATFEDDLAKDAKWKKHTTIGQAIEIGQKVNAWRTILTHFSPRYQKIAEIADRNFETKTMVAFDHMRIKLSQFEWAYKMLDIYKKLFNNDDIVAEDASEKIDGGGKQSGKNKQKSGASGQPPQQRQKKQ